QSKGRVLDAMFDSLGTLRRRFNEQDRILLDDLSDARTKLATLVFRGPSATNPAQYQTETKRLKEAVEKLEAEISERSAEFRTQSQPVKLEAVRAMIPQDAILIEYFSYLPYNAKSGKWGASRYVAYTFGHQGEPGLVDLGEAQEIDRAVVSLRQ